MIMHIEVSTAETESNKNKEVADMTVPCKLLLEDNGHHTWNAMNAISVTSRRDTLDNIRQEVGEPSYVGVTATAMVLEKK